MRQAGIGLGMAFAADKAQDAKEAKWKSKVKRRDRLVELYKAQLEVMTSQDTFMPIFDGSALYHPLVSKEIWGGYKRRKEEIKQLEAEIKKKK